MQLGEPPPPDLCNAWAGSDRLGGFNTSFADDYKLYSKSYMGNFITLSKIVNDWSELNYVINAIVTLWLVY